MTGALALALAASAFTWVETDGRFELRDNGRPVLTYNERPQLANGAPENKRRSGYVHPVWAPNGVVLTDDFPQDHWHHRGVFWAWPVVRRPGGKTYDLWTLTGGVESRPAGRTSCKTGATARLDAENRWYIENEPAVRETLRIEVEPARSGSRRATYTLTLEAIGNAVEIGGWPEEKGYGGFSVRFAPRTGTAIATDRGIEAKDTDMVPHPFAELRAEYGGKRASLRIDQDPSNPGYPAGWCLRKYGFLGVNWPGLEPARLLPGKPVTLRYTVTVTGE